MKGKEQKYLTFKSYFGYTLGMPGNTIMNQLISSFIMLFITNAMGMNSAIVGVIMLVAKFIDAVTDIAFGAIMDATHSKHGKAKTWLLRMGLPMIISGVLLFFIPGGGSALSYVYFAIIYILYNTVCYTATNMAFQAMAVRMTKNATERVLVFTCGMILQMGVGIGLGFVTQNLVESFGGGTGGWHKVAILMAVIAVVLYLICMVCCKELPEETLNVGMPSAAPKGEKFSVKEMFASLAGNKYVWIWSAYTLLFAIASGMYNTCGAYYATYVLNNPALLGLVTICTLLPMIVALLLTPAFVSKFGLHKTMSRGYLIASIAGIGMCVFAVMRQPALMFVCLCLRGLFSGPVNGAAQAVNGSIIEYSMISRGRDITGSLFGINTLAGKIGEGVCSALVGALLAVSGYDGTAAVQCDSAVTMIILLFAGVPMVCFLINALLIWKTDPDVKVAEYRKEHGLTDNRPQPPVNQ